MNKMFKIVFTMAVILIMPYVVDAACTQTLYAGKNIDVGTVTFSDDETVTYNLKDGWIMTEAHLHLATKLSGIPQNKNGNPIPGKFQYKKYYNPGVATDTFSTGPWSCGKTLYIAAHAVVTGYSEVQKMTIVSDTQTLVIQGNEPGATYPKNAVLAWEPFNDPVDPAPSYWDEIAGTPFTGTTADWIWESYRPIHTVSGDIVEFERSFKVPGKILSAILDITCDNGYEVKLDGQLVGSAQLFGDWRTPVYCPQDNKYMFLRDPIFDDDGNLIVPGVERYGWKSTEEYNISKDDSIGTACDNKCNKFKNRYRNRNRNKWFDHYDITDKLKCQNDGSTHKLHITGVNEAMTSEVICGYEDQGFDGDADDNPAGLIYKLEITYTSGSSSKEETAWAAGLPFPGRNWATYFICSTPACGQ